MPCRRTAILVAQQRLILFWVGWVIDQPLEFNFLIAEVGRQDKVVGFHGLGFEGFEGFELGAEGGGLIGHGGDYFLNMFSKCH